MESKGKKFIVNKNKTILDSFKNALNGIKSAYATEYHMVIHCYFAVAVIVCAALFQISYVEWLICFCLIGAVIALELVNTAIESVVNMITTEYNFHAKVAKDTASGAVLVMSIISAVVGLIIFVPKFFELF
ncbi:MAG: diacylglycerol kinase family protein [Bacilli bacterium]|nr:diacylglycerol kinase family protein [Bacilli bacterium]